MAVRSAPASSLGTEASRLDRDAAIVADGVSKRYPVTPVTVFPPVTSIFERQLFKRKRSSEEEGTDQDAEASRARGAPAAGARPPARRRDDELDDDLELDDEEDEFDEVPERVGGPTPDKPGEMFWALKDVSFRVPRGAAFGILGAQGSGKTTLLNIVGGQAFPTEGRVLVRGKVSPLPAALAKAINMTSRGTFKMNLPLASRLLGVQGHEAKRHREEIEEMAQPIESPEGEPLPGAIVRLAIATAVVLPTNVILLDEPLSDDAAFMEQVVERVRKRLRRGSSLVLASRGSDLARELCDDVITLDGGSNETSGRSTGGQSRGAAIAPSRYLSEGRELEVPAVVSAFNQSAALLSATLRTGGGRSKRVDAAVDEVAVEISFETALPDVEAHHGVTFRPRDGEGTGIRLEFPEPLRFARPGTYTLVARTVPGALRAGAYDVRADAIVANPSERGASVIARNIGRVRIVGEEAAAPEGAEPPAPHWDGAVLSRAEAEWSIE